MITHRRDICPAGTFYPSPDPMHFKTRSSRVIFAGRVFNLRSDQVQLPDGRNTSLDILEHGGAVVIVPQMDSGELVMIRQYRHAAGKMLLEFPAGTLEKGEDPLLCAQRELREETGYAAEEMAKIGGFYLAPGYSTEFLHIYYARGLNEDPLPQDSDEWLEVETHTVETITSLVKEGGLEDAKSVAAFFMMLEHQQSEKE